jgi:hypothetical protein
VSNITIGDFDANYQDSLFVSPAASIGTRLSPNVAGQSDSLPFLTTSSSTGYLNEVDLPFNTSICSYGSGYRPTCVLWNNITSIWNTTGVTSGVAVNGNVMPCYFTSSTYFMGPFALYAMVAVAPSITSIVAKPSTMTIIISFDQSTNSPTSICSSLFDSTTLTLLGGSVTCTWTSSTVLTLTNFAVTMRVGLPVTLLGGVIYSLDGFSTPMLTTSKYLTVQLGETVATTAALISGPNAAGGCENANFTGSSSVGGAGLDLYYSWSVTNVATPTVPYLTFAGYGVAYTTINFDYTLTAATYSVSLTVISWLNSNSTLTMPFVKSAQPVPYITFSPSNSYFVSRNAAFNATTLATISPCITSGTAVLTTTWSVVSIPSGATTPTMPSSTTSATSSLYLVPYTFIPGLYTLSVTVSQLVSGSTTTSVAYLYVTVAQTPAPKRLSATFNLACIRVDIAFDSATDLSGNGNCALLLPSTTLALLGTGYSCVWSDAMTYTIILGSAYLLRDGSTVNINNGIIGSGDGYSPKESGLPLMLQPPATEPTVTALISAPTLIGACRGIDLDGSDSSGAAGLPDLFTYKWTTVSPTPTASMSNITAAITSLSLLSTSSGVPLRTLSLPSSLFAVNTSYGFTLTVTNWRGVSSTSDVISIYKSSDTQLEVDIEGLVNRNVVASATLLGVGDYTVASLCGVGVASVTYQWSQTNGPQLDVLLGNSTSTMITSPYQLQSSITYSFQLYVTVTTVFGGTLSSSATTNWYVTPSSLIPVVNGGNRLVSLYSATSSSIMPNITIDGSRSYDPDVFGNKARNGIAYNWTCTVVSTGASCPFVSSPVTGLYPNLTASKLIIRRDQLPSSLQSTLVNTDSLSFVLTIFKDIRTATSTSNIVTTTTYVPSVSVQPISSTTIGSTSGSSSDSATVRVAVSSSLTLRASISPITSTTQLLWVCTSNNFNLSNPSNVMSPLTNADLVIAANVLTGGNIL